MLNIGPVAVTLPDLRQCGLMGPGRHLAYRATKHQLLQAWQACVVVHATERRSVLYYSRRLGGISNKGRPTDGETCKSRPYVTFPEQENNITFFLSPLIVREFQKKDFRKDTFDYQCGKQIAGRKEKKNQLSCLVGADVLGQ